MIDKFKIALFTIALIGIFTQVNTSQCLAQNIKDNGYAGDISHIPKDALNFSPVLNPENLPDDFPKITIYTNDNPAPGAFYFTNRSSKTNYLIVMGNDGKILAYKPDPYVVGKFTVQPNGLMTYNPTVKRFFMAFSQSIVYVLDEGLNIIDSMLAKNEYSTSPHECTMLPNGNTLLTGFDAIYYDISKEIQGGHHDALLAGAFVQELDNDKNLVFQWRSWDHYDITETTQQLDIPVTLFSNFNSVFMSNDGNLLICNRLYSEILKVNRNSGEIIWRLGGEKNDFKFIGENEDNAPFYFSLQHDVRVLPNGNITLFDNGNQHTPSYSRAVEYQLDEVNMTAKMVWEYRTDPDQFGSSQGSMQRLHNGNTVIGWGSVNDIDKIDVSEIRPDGSVAHEFAMEKDNNSHRALKFPWPVNKPTAEVMLEELLILNKYTFNKGNIETGITLSFSDLRGFLYNRVNAQKFEYGPQNPRFDEEIAPIVAPYRFTLKGFQIDEFTGEVRFNISKLEWISEPELWSIYTRETPGSGVFKKLETSFDASRDELFATINKFGEFIFAKTFHITSPKAPLLTYPEHNAATISSAPIKLRWSPQGYVTGSVVQVAGDESFTHIIFEKELNEALIELDDLQIYYAYFWRVKSVNPSGESQWSEVRRFETSHPTLKMVYPNGGETLRRGANYIIRWEQNFIDSVKIELLIEGALYSTITAKTLSHTGAWLWTIPNDVELGSRYEIRVTSLKHNNAYAESAGWITIDDKETSVESEEIYSNGNMINSFYPNPTSVLSKVIFSLDNSAKVNFTVVDMRGKVQFEILAHEFSAGQHSVTFNCATLTAGTYVFVLQAGNRFETKRFVVVK